MPAIDPHWRTLTTRNADPLSEPALRTRQCAGGPRVENDYSPQAR